MKRSFILTSRRIAVGLLAAGFTAGASAEFVVQPVGWHSYLVAGDGLVKDTKLRSEFERAFDAGIGAQGNRADFVVTMGQCQGGGMLDDLSTAPASSMNSAAQHDERAWTTDGARKNRRSAYLDQWGRAIDNAVNPTMAAAATTARANDPAGPVLKTYQTTYGAKFLEHPQYTSSGGAGDAIKLRDSTPAKAIVYAGGDTSWDSFNSLKQVYDVLKGRYGYADADIYVCYNAAADPDGGALPFVRDDAGTKAGLTAAFDWLDGLTTGTTQPDVLFWNYGHGARAKDAKAELPNGSTSGTFSLDSQFIVDYDTPDENVINTWLRLEYTGLSSSNTLYVNGQEVASLSSGDGEVEIELDPSMIQLFESGNLLELIGADSFDNFAAIEFGVTTSGNMVPEPASILLLVLGAAAALRRRR